MPTPASVFCPKLLPSLKSMRLGLVNFCGHFPYGGYQFDSLVRWHLGPIVNELIITGAPDADQEDFFSNEKKVLHQNCARQGPCRICKSNTCVSFRQSQTTQQIWHHPASYSGRQGTLLPIGKGPDSPRRRSTFRIFLSSRKNDMEVNLRLTPKLGKEMDRSTDDLVIWLMRLIGARYVVRFVDQ
jgi:hypothetical protein